MQLTRVLDLLHKRFADPIRVEDLCSTGNLSPRSLHRLFVRHVGENLSDYLGRLRIGRACMLLVETDRADLVAIASEAGFSEPIELQQAVPGCTRYDAEGAPALRHGIRTNAGLSSGGGTGQPVAVAGSRGQAD